jgi:hypothetical protein
MLYAAIFLPGVAVHEMSHWLMAKLLGVKTNKFSLWPQRQPNGVLRLGYVETGKVDFVREALIGIAPLLAGSAVVVLIGYERLGIGPLGIAIAQGKFDAMIQGVAATVKSADVLIWLYLIFTVSNSMLPSESDRRAWLPVGITLIILAIGLYYFGAGPLMLRGLGVPLAAGIRVIASAFSITIGVDLLIIPLVWLIEKGLSRVTGFKVNY